LEPFFGDPVFKILSFQQTPPSASRRLFLSNPAVPNSHNGPETTKLHASAQTLPKLRYMWKFATPSPPNYCNTLGPLRRRPPFQSFFNPLIRTLLYTAQWVPAMVSIGGHRRRIRTPANLDWSRRFCPRSNRRARCRSTASAISLTAIVAALVQDRFSPGLKNGRDSSAQAAPATQLFIQIIDFCQSHAARRKKSFSNLYRKSLRRHWTALAGATATRRG